MAQPGAGLTPFAKSLSAFLVEAGWEEDTKEDLTTFLGGTTTDNLELGYMCNLAPDSDQVAVSVVFEHPVGSELHLKLLMLMNEMNKGALPGAVSYHFDDKLVEVCSSLLVGGLDELEPEWVEEIAVDSFLQVHELLIGVALAAHMAISELAGGASVEDAFSKFTGAVDTFIAALEIDLEND
ncbi:MAG: YbjN domain-containing protein [Actinomycetota bacterium]|nr:YbjN domain-containing protein [Actinomycetota bacterium]